MERLARDLEQRFGAPGPEVMTPEHFRELLARQPDEPQPIGHEYFEHLREEGA